MYYNFLNYHLNPFNTLKSVTHVLPRLFIFIKIV